MSCCCNHCVIFWLFRLASKTCLFCSFCSGCFCLRLFVCHLVLFFQVTQSVFRSACKLWLPVLQFVQIGQGRWCQHSSRACKRHGCYAMHKKWGTSAVAILLQPRIILHILRSMLFCSRNLVRNDDKASYNLTVLIHYTTSRASRVSKHGQSGWTEKQLGRGVVQAGVQSQCFFTRKLWRKSMTCLIKRRERRVATFQPTYSRLWRGHWQQLQERNSQLVDVLCAQFFAVQAHVKSLFPPCSFNIFAQAYHIKHSKHIPNISKCFLQLHHNGTCSHEYVQPWHGQ